MFGTVKKRASDSLFTATIKNVKNSCKANFTGSTVLQDNVDMHDAESDDVLWHKRMANTSYSTIREMVGTSMNRMNTVDSLYRKQCTTSAQTNLSRKPSIERLIDVLDNVTIHADICGSLKTPSDGGRRYILTFIAVHQRYVTVQVVKSRWEISKHCLNYFSWIGRHSACRVKWFH